jgi:hypothetical protein
MERSPIYNSHRYDGLSSEEYIIVLRGDAQILVEREKKRPAPPKETISSKIKQRLIKFGRALVSSGGNT